MTPSEILKRECEEITQRTGIYIPTYRFPTVMKNASKMVELLMKSDVLMSYAEAVLTVRIVLSSLEKITGEKGE